MYRPIRGQVRSHKARLTPVGAELSAKAVFQTQKMHRMYRPIREQARSHKVRLTSVGASLLAKAIFQTQ
ncbi:hypothetical protein A244_25166 [Pseudomonas syringae pv. actinidiae ICMP 18807]|uniref:Uncharacterized protein n=1 Tax=Pseudomonas syringae pv. actinidiae ICMP 18807 TaxID=1194404 RepID=S6TUL9_PSESF|nr:hypothetical protein A244_25166 [Pseudomonas syringae pv. actinidiae ICMP 18807]